MPGPPPFATYVPSASDLPPGFEVLGPGEFGGKARGLLYASLLLHRHGVPLAGKHTPLLRIPDSAVLGTALFDQVLAEQGIEALARQERGPAAHDALVRAKVPAGARERFREFLARTTVPLAVRSSSLLEDNPLYSFSGIYRTIFLANQGPPEDRLAAFEAAVLRVMASAFHPRADAYRRRHGAHRRDEKMAVLVQHAVGRRRGDLFYPLIAGVGFSRNMYPWTDRVRVEDGVVRVVYGLGTRAVGRSYARVFVPAQHTLRPEGHGVDDIERYAQDRMDALDLRTGEFRTDVRFDEVVAIPGNDLHLVSSLVREGEFLQEARFPLGPDDRFVVTFDELIAGHRGIPLVETIRALFESLEGALGMPVDLEFAAMAAHGAEDERDLPETLHLLQVRPLGVREAHRRVAVDPGGGRVVIRSTRVMGNGERRDIGHVVFVRAQDYVGANPGDVVREIARLNESLEGKPYALVGPGRWGSSNPALGVPVPYDAVSGAVAVVEVATARMTPEVSYGTHWFGDMLASGCFYMAVVPREGHVLDEAFLREHARPPAHGVRLVVPPRPLTIQVDGLGRQGVAFLPR